MRTLITIDGQQVPWQIFATDQKRNPSAKIHLSPANGIPVASYQSFVEGFNEIYSVTGMDCRGAWPTQSPPVAKFNWLNHADDLIAAIESQYSEAVIGMGHSLGGTITLLAALKRPELFSRLVIIEPATLPSKLISHLYPLIPAWLSFRLFSFIRRTHHRQAIWKSHEAFINNYKNHPTYRRFTEGAMCDYANFGLSERDDGQYQLVFNPEWESFNFRRVPYLWSALQQTTHPTLLLRAAHSMMYSHENFAHKTAHLPNNINVQTIPGADHLVSHEMPKALSTQILNWL